jgi:general secretion pathway protein A
MYETFYGLKENPFEITPNPQYLFLGKNHREALARMRYGIQERKGFILITGEVGTGKTILIRHLVGNLDGSKNADVKTVLIFNPKLTANDFLYYILRELAVTIRGNSKGDHLRDLNEYLLKANERGEKVVLIVDEAQGLKPALLEEIRLLSNLETPKTKLLQIILVGQPELRNTLCRREFRQLRQRINLHFHLLPLSEEQTRAYIEKRITIAGGKDPLFATEAVQEIYRRTKGVPRLINILCDNALLAGFAADQKTIDEKLVKDAADDLELS